MRTKELGLIVSNVGTMLMMESHRWYEADVLYAGFGMLALGVVLVVYSRDSSL